MHLAWGYLSDEHPQSSVSFQVLMLAFDLPRFVSLMSATSAVIQGLANLDQTKLDMIAPTDFKGHMATVVESLKGDCAAIGLEMTVTAIDRVSQNFRVEQELISYRQIIDRINEVVARLFDEIESKGKFFHAPPERAKYFEKPEMYGQKVTRKFPKLTEDITEAGNCFVAGRYTACVFHLMRIMEYALQRFGAKLGVTFPENKVWQMILNEVNSKIKAMDHKQPETKKYAEIAGHLYHIKLAWRNEVMHPKATYTETEAKNLIEQVGEFVNSLSSVI
jgi:hypothetical protein